MSSGLLRPDAGLNEKSALIEVEKANYKIAWMCRMLDVLRSSFYQSSTSSEVVFRPAM